MNDGHVLVQQGAINIWFRQVEYAKNADESIVRRNFTSSENELMALSFRTKPHTIATVNKGVRAVRRRLQTRVSGDKRNTYILQIPIERKKAGWRYDVALGSVSSGCTGNESAVWEIRRSHRKDGRMGVGLTTSFLSTCYPRASRNLIASFGSCRSAL